MRLLRGVVLMALLVVLPAGPALARPVDGQLEDSTATVSARDAYERSRDSDVVEPDPAKRLIDWMQSPSCAGDGSYLTALRFWETYPCDVVPPEDQRLDCDGDEPQEPWWSRTRATADAEWGEWVQRTDWYCPVDLLPELTVQDFRRLPIAPSPLTMQPDRGWVLVNKETIAYSDAEEHTLRTEVLGVGVDVVVTPTSFTWAFGDDKPFTTKGPGHAYPDQDVSRPFTQLGKNSISLTTTWSGRYRVDGDSHWRDVAGTATTTSTTPVFEVVERRSVLIDRG